VRLRPGLLRAAAALAVALVAGGCATGRAFDARAIGRLERERTAHPESADAQRDLGIAYYHAGRPADARSALEIASRLAPRDGLAARDLGLADERLDDPAGARRAYAAYLEVGREGRLRRRIEGRLAALARRELVEEARRSVRQERMLGDIAGPPNTVAVLPLRVTGDDSTLQPLARGLAELLTTDLSRSARLSIVERARVQALLDELALQRSGATDSATSARAGRLLRAGRVVQGAVAQLDPARLRLDAAVVDVPTARLEGSTSESDQLEALFDLEKRVALALFDELGVTLTVAERNAVEQRPTRSLAAFLAYSRGIAAEDEGRYRDASRFFREALRLDPGFAEAAARSRETEGLQLGGTLTPSVLEAEVRAAAEEVAPRGRGRGRDVADAVRDLADDLNPSAAAAATAPGRSAAHGPPERDPASAATGSDQPGKSGRVKIRGPRRNPK
jgi:tetratricopeptide (TPR) repeat protein